METQLVSPDDFDTEAFRLNPFPIYRILRESHPVYYNPQNDTWLITRYDDVVSGFKDHQRLSNRLGQQSDGVVFGPSITAMDGEEHSKKRNLVAQEFVGKRLEPFLPIIEANTVDLIAKFAERNANRLIEEFGKTGEVDLVEQFTTRLPLNVTLDILGLPKDHHEFFHDCYTVLMAGLGPEPVARANAIQKNAEFHEYLEPIVRERNRRPGDDLISRLCGASVDGQRLSPHEIKSFVSLLLAAGGETTDKAVANLWWLLLNHPKQMEAVRQHPELLDQAFTETMRHSGPVGRERREAMEEIEWHGHVIPRGAIVVLSMHSANHDDSIFTDADEFNIYRDDLYVGRDLRVGYKSNGRASHVGFGLGKHFCIGYQLARAEAVIGSRLLLQAMPNVRIKEGQNPRMGEGMSMRSVKRLPLQFDVV